MEYQLCRHTHDDGRPCGSAAAEHRDYCSYHLGYRVRQLRIAQHRARGERFDLKLPPLESMHAVQSALTQLSEALAADMIDLKRADRLMRLLTIASRNLLKADKWPAGIVHSDQPGPAVDLAAQYGLPADLDVDTPPELAFPRPALSHSVILSEERSDESKDPFVSPNLSQGAPPLSPDFGDRVGATQGAPRLSFAAANDRVGESRPPLLPEIPPFKPRDYAAEAELAFSEVTPQDVELDYIRNSFGYKAMERRAREHQRAADRKLQRQLFRANYQHYVAVAKMKNIERAAEKLLAQRQAAEHAAAQQSSVTQPEAVTAAAIAAEGIPIAPPVSKLEGIPIAPSVGKLEGIPIALSVSKVEGCPIPPAVGGVGLLPDATKKPVASVTGDATAKEVATA